jgi:hypothetical protein
MASAAAMLSRGWSGAVCGSRRNVAGTRSASTSGSGAHFGQIGAATLLGGLDRDRLPARAAGRSDRAAMLRAFGPQRLHGPGAQLDRFLDRPLEALRPHQREVERDTPGERPRLRASFANEARDAARRDAAQFDDSRAANAVKDLNLIARAQPQHPRDLRRLRRGERALSARTQSARQIEAMPRRYCSSPRRSIRFYGLPTITSVALTMATT